jgi:hypothetical protein
MTAPTTTERAAINSHAAARGCRYRITSAGRVDFFGAMPNSDAVGWYAFATDAREALDMIARENPA